LEIGNKRNDIVHSSWNATSRGDFHQQRVRPKGSDTQTDDVALAPAEIDSVTEEALDLIFELEAF
jgi:hypothetical protein